MSEVTPAVTIGGPGRLPYIALDEWKSIVKGGGAGDQYNVTKGRFIEHLKLVKEGPDGPASMRIVISTPDVDRSRDTIDQSKWELGNYNMNPVVLFGHDYWSPSIGKAPRTFVEQGKLVSYPEFCPPDLYPFGDMIGRMVAGGYMSAASVGFRPKEWVFDEERGGVNFLGQELTEWSIVPVPDNPFALADARKAWSEALTRSKSAGLDLTPLVGLVRSSASWLRKAGIVIPDDVEETLAALNSGRKSVDVGDVKLTLNAGDYSIDEIEGVVEKALGARVDLVEKIGRKLSRKNETRIRDAHTRATEAAGYLDECLKELDAAVEETPADPPPAEASADGGDAKGAQSESETVKSDTPASAPAPSSADAPIAPATGAAETKAAPKVVIRSDDAPASSAPRLVLRGTVEDLKLSMTGALKAAIGEIDREAAGALPD